CVDDRMRFRNAGRGGTVNDNDVRNTFSRWWPLTWALWRLPRTALVYVLTIEVLAFTAVLIAPRELDGGRWAPAGLLAACAMLHVHASKAIERVRRDHSHLPHVDLCSVWILAGALVLPAAAEIALVVLIYLHRWLVVGRV